LFNFNSSGGKFTAPVSTVKDLRFAPIRFADCALDCLRLVRFFAPLVGMEKSVMASYRKIWI